MYNKKLGIYVTKFDFEYFFNSILSENLSGASFSKDRIKFFIGITDYTDKAKKIIEFFNGVYDENGNELIIKNLDEFRKNVMKFIEDRINHSDEYWVVKLLSVDECSEGEWVNGLETYYFETELEARMFANNSDMVVYTGKEKVFDLKLDV